MASWTDTLLDGGWVPDPVVRFGIRRYVERRDWPVSLAYSGSKSHICSPVLDPVPPLLKDHCPSFLCLPKRITTRPCPNCSSLSVPVVCSLNVCRSFQSNR